MTPIYKLTELFDSEVEITYHGISHAVFEIGGIKYVAHIQEMKEKN